jgi:hypothetical protein
MTDAGHSLWRNGPPAVAPSTTMPPWSMSSTDDQSASGEILMEPEEQDYGGANCAARDPEAFVRSCGTYDPWAPMSGE